VRPLEGVTVVDLSRHLPGPFASRELLELGARVIRLLPPTGDPMAELAPAWHEAMNAGKETVLLDLKAEPEQGRALCTEADVVVESFRPGVVERLGVGPDDLPESVVYCSLTGFGSGGSHVARAGHDLNYLGWAGVLADTAPAMPPTQIADLAGGALTAVTRILAALLERQRTGRGARIVVSMTHSAHKLVSHRLGGEPIPQLLTGGLACYRIYATADGRYLTVAALEHHFFVRLCDLLELSELSDRHFDLDAQKELGDALAERIASKPLAAWLELFDGEDVSVGPVATLEEAAMELA
jgi:crotonobetainyl-CoA:carnitine CoA-transferase CaiB-like acyl-CoA transferase